MKISVADFSAPIEASVFKFCVLLQVGKMYCLNENKDAKAHLTFFFNFYFFPSVTHLDIFHQSFLRNHLIKDYEIFNKFVFSLKVFQPLMATARGM